MSSVIEIQPEKVGVLVSEPHVKKRSISDADNFEWKGWDWLVKLYNHFEDKPVIQASVMLGFQTGGRVNEFVRLKRSMFSQLPSGDWLVKKMPLEKQYRRVAGSMTMDIKSEDPHDPAYKGMFIDGVPKWVKRISQTIKKSDAVRADFAFYYNEPLIPNMVSWFDKFQPDDYLLPHPDKTRAGQPISSWVVWKFLGKECFPHLLRSQRASCLGVQYEWTAEDIARWFNWSGKSGIDMAQRYTKKSPTQLLDKYRGFAETLPIPKNPNTQLFSSLNQPQVATGMPITYNNYDDTLRKGHRIEPEVVE